MGKTFQTVSECRLCHSLGLELVLDLGSIALTGVFPKTSNIDVPRTPVQLGICTSCSLVQLLHSYDDTLLFGPTYGYRSGLNSSMKTHLQRLATELRRKISIEAGDVVLDIGGNDGTFLQNFLESEADLLLMDPLATKFSDFYDDRVVSIPEYFSSSLFFQNSEKRASLITSIAMFYDLNDPLTFARQVFDCLQPDGTWFLEVSHSPTMANKNSYDTICHEHALYLSLGLINRIAVEAGMSVVDAWQTEANGGSIAVVCRKGGGLAMSRRAEMILAQEGAQEITSHAKFWAPFAQRSINHQEQFRRTLERFHDRGFRVAGTGASTKGNVLLQAAGVGPELLPLITEINPDKFGAFTPGSCIPIRSEKELVSEEPFDVGIVLPWHFRDGFVKALETETPFLNLLFPLPQLELVSR